MDDHAQRVCDPLLRGWDDFVEGRGSLDDLARLAGQARFALDSSVEPLPDLLWAAELEWLSFEGREVDHDAARRYLDPIVVALRRAT